MAELPGYRPDEARGRRKWDVLSAADRPAVQALFERCGAGVSGPADARFRHRDGRAVWSLVSARPRVGAGGRADGARDMFTDLTEMPAPARPGRPLVVGDEVELETALRESLRGEGFDAGGHSDPAAGLAALRDGEFDVPPSDLMTPGTGGVRPLRRGLAADPDLVGIIMTGQGPIQTAAEAMKAGAFGSVLKPFRPQQTLPVLGRAAEVRRRRRENARRRVIQALTFESPRHHPAGASPALRKVLGLIEKVAPTGAAVPVRGPSGAGKGLVARAPHGNSPRRDKPLVTVNCATLREALLESELFGHARGSFTGADKVKPGLFEVAEGGTLFIDEVAERSPALRAKLLRVLEDGHDRRVGSTQERRADVRVVAATNRPLEDEQTAGSGRTCSSG